MSVGESLTDVLRGFKNAISDSTGAFTIYTFGSTSVGTRGEDVDLILVYADSLPLGTAVQARRLLRDMVENSTGLPADISLLTQRELDSSDFLARTQAEEVPL